MRKTIMMAVMVFSLLGILLTVVDSCLAEGEGDLEQSIKNLTEGVRNICLALAVLGILVAGVAKMFFGRMDYFWGAVIGTGICLLASAIAAFLKARLGG